MDRVRPTPAAATALRVPTRRHTIPVVRAEAIAPQAAVVVAIAAEAEAEAATMAEAVVVVGTPVEAADTDSIFEY